MFWFIIENVTQQHFVSRNFALPDSIYDRSNCAIWIFFWRNANVFVLFSRSTKEKAFVLIFAGKIRVEKSGFRRLEMNEKQWNVWNSLRSNDKDQKWVFSLFLSFTFISKNKHLRCIYFENMKTTNIFLRWKGDFNVNINYRWNTVVIIIIGIIIVTCAQVCVELVDFLWFVCCTNNRMNWLWAVRFTFIFCVFFVSTIHKREKIVQSKMVEMKKRESSTATVSRQ